MSEDIVLLLRRDDPLAWTVMPQVCAKIKWFRDYWHEGYDAEKLSRALEVGFVSDDPEIMAIVSVDAGANLTGYVLFAFGEWLGEKFVNVLQYWIEDGHARAVERTRFFLDGIGRWGAARGATEIRCMAYSPKLARAYRAFYGFSPKPYTLMTRPIEREVQDGR